MKSDRLCAAAVTFAIAAVIGLCLGGCSSQGAGNAASFDPDLRDSTEVACELALLRVKDLLDKRSSESEFPPAPLAEATELYRLGKELYLEREYDLALELLEEAIQLLEEHSD